MESTYEIHAHMAFRTIDIKKEGSSQVIAIPGDLAINDDKVYLKKVGNVIYLIPFHNPWQSMIDGAQSFSDDFMEERDQPEMQVRDDID